MTHCIYTKKNHKIPLSTFLNDKEKKLHNNLQKCIIKIWSRSFMYKKKIIVFKIDKEKVLYTK